MIRLVALATVAVSLSMGAPAAEVRELFYRSEGVPCRLTWSGHVSGWRLQSATPDGAFDDAGAVQKLAAFMGEQSPSRAQGFCLTEKDGVRICRAADGTCVSIDPAGRLDVRSASGRLVTERVRVVAAAGKAVLSGRLCDGEAVYGLGERLDRLNKRGQRVTLYTSDGYNDSTATYLAIPLFTTPRGGGVFVNLYDRMIADFGVAEADAWRMEVDRPSLDVYLFAKDRIPEAIEAYTALSGHADRPEDWNCGPIVCRYYPDLTRLEGPFACTFRGMTLRGHGLREMMERHISLGVKPTAVIIEGGNYVDLFVSDEKRAEFRRMAAYLRERGIRLMVYMRMGSVCSKSAPGYRPDFNVSVSLSTNGLPAVAETKMIPDRLSKGMNPDVGRAKAHEEADITDPAFWDWYVNTVWRDLVEEGVSGVKIDFCEEMPEEGENPGGVGVHYRWKDPSVFAGTSVHHAYPTFFISRFYREMSRLTKERGGFMVLSRGGGIGSQRNPYIWAGDQQRLFEKLDDQLLALLNAGMSGVPFMTYDLAGYQYRGLYAAPDGKIGKTAVTVRRGRGMDARAEAEIFRRGVEFSAFTTCVQSHGFVRNAYDFDAATCGHYRKYMTFHASLSNLIARVNREASERGVPPVRPLVWAYPDDPKTWDIADEFMLGDALLVAPSFGRERREDVYLPAGDWERVEGLEIPVYVNRKSASFGDCAALLSFDEAAALRKARKLVWSDEFEGEALDPAKWRFRATMRSKDCLYANDARTYEVKDSKLCLHVVPSPDPTKRCLLPRGVATHETMGFKYGYLEMRAKVPFRHGAWPSWWMTVTPGMRKCSWGSEIDIFEVFSSKNSVVANLHKWGKWDPEKKKAAHVMLPGGEGRLQRKRSFSFYDYEGLNDEFHVYGFEWTPLAVSFFVDGMRYCTIPIDEANDYSPKPMQGMAGHHDFHSVIFNNEVFTPGHGWMPEGAELKPEDLPIHYEIDWIRLWQKDGEELEIRG